MDKMGTRYNIFSNRQNFLCHFDTIFYNQLKHNGDVRKVFSRHDIASMQKTTWTHPLQYNFSVILTQNKTQNNHFSTRQYFTFKHTILPI